MSHHDHHHEPPAPGSVDWRHNGVRVIKGNQLDHQHRANPRHEPRRRDQRRPRRGAEDLGWHGQYPRQRQNRCPPSRRAGKRDLRGPGRPACGGAKTWSSSPKPSSGDFIFVPPYVPHQEINASSDETLECVLVRSDNEAVVVNLDIEPVEKPEAVYWVDPIHKHP